MPDIRLNCPQCDNNLEVEDQGAGMEVNCPHCGQPITIPKSRLRVTIFLLLIASVSFVTAQFIRVGLNANFVVELIITFLLWFFILGGLALLGTALASRVRTHSVMVFAWLFLLASIYQIIVGSYARFVVEPKIRQQLKQLTERIPPSVGSNGKGRFKWINEPNPADVLSKPVAGEPYLSPDHTFSIVVPVGWSTKKSDQPDTVIKFVFRDGGGRIAVLSIAAYDESTQIGGNALTPDSMYEAFKSEYPKFTIRRLASGKTKIRSVEAVWNQIEFTDPPQIRMLGKHYHLRKGGKLWRISAMTDSGKDFFETALPTMEDSISTLAFYSER